MNKHHRRPGQGHHSRVRRLPVPRPPKIFDEIATTEAVATHDAPPHEMYFDTKAYADAISQLAKALTELGPQAVYELFEECEYLLLHDLAENSWQRAPGLRRQAGGAAAMIVAGIDPGICGGTRCRPRCRRRRRHRHAAQAFYVEHRKPHATSAGEDDPR